jgi:hypothetical protein
MKTITRQTNASLKRALMSSAFAPLALALVFVGLAHVARGVSPAPDGGYPGGNTAEGQNSLFSLTTGGFNTGVGFLSLRSNTAGNFNTAIGAGALLANGADNNTATGAGALLSNTTGSRNTANGAFALFSNTDGIENSALGWRALGSNTTGSDNTATGYEALFFNDAGGSGNANFNSAFGAYALLFNSDGSRNSALGWGALTSNTTGNDNTATGAQVLLVNTTGTANTASGEGTLSSNTTGNNNVALGFHAGENQTTGSNNVYIGAGLVGIAGESNACYIGSIFGQTSGGGAAVLINATGKLGTTTSSKRFKKDIRPMDEVSEALYSLKPVAFRYKKEIDPAGTSQVGLVAEDVEKVNPELVVHDKEGKPYTVRYDQVNAMLLNEFLKEHGKVQQLEVAVAQQRNDFDATIAELKKEIAGVVARSRDQDEKIQKVSGRVELNGTVSRKVANK